MTDADGRLDRAVRALVDTPAGSLLVAGVSRARQRWPEAELLRRAGESATDAIAQEGGFVSARLRFGPHLLVDARDEESRRLITEGELEPATTRLLERIATPGWTFFDIGAQHGYFSVLARHLGGPDSVVCAFEADPNLASHLAQNATTADDPRGILVVAARCGARRETRYGIHGPELVSTIDDHCDTHGLAPDVVRLRADGTQLEVLEGMRRQLRRGTTGHVICSAGWRDDASAIERFLLGYDYVLSEAGELTESLCFERG